MLDLSPSSAPISRSASSLQEAVHPPEEIKEERGKSLGTKSIGTFLSFIFVINQIYGPGVLAIPLVYQQSGFLLVLVAVSFFLAVSSLASTCMAQAIASIPDNRQFQQRVEFGTAVEYYFGHNWGKAFQVCLNLTVQAYNVASVVICAQSIDQAMVTLAGSTYAFEFVPNFGFHAFADVDMLYSSDHITISLGYMIILLFFMPAGFLNLNDNVATVQVASFVFLVALMLELCGFFVYKGNQTGWYAVPAFGHTYPQLVSVFIFSWAYVIFVPSWLNEKKPGVSVNKVIWSAGIASWVGYVAIGWLCVSALGKSGIGLDNILVALTHKDMPTLTRIVAHLFSLGVIAPGIPVCSVTTRYNLYVGGVCGKKQSYFWGCIAPWIIGFIFCQGEIFANMLNWTSLVVNGLVNFLVPFVLYAASLRLVGAGGAPSDGLDRIQAESHAAGGAGAFGGDFDESPTLLVSSDVGTLQDDGDEDEKSSVRMDRTRSVSAKREFGAAGSLGAPLLSSPSQSSTYGDPASPIGGLGPRGHMLAPPTLEHTESGAHVVAVHFVPPLSEDYLHGPVYPFPRWMRPHAYRWAIAIAVVVESVILAQTIGDIVFAAQGGDPLA